MTSPGRVLFVSDCHLGAGNAADDRAREARLLAFLKHEAASAEALYLLGDLFDFWFEYRHAVPRHHFAILTALRRLVDAGVRVTFVGGNHDFWAGSFLRDEVGCEVHWTPTEAVVQGRRLFLAHGDGLMHGDRGYLFLKSVLRHPWAIASYRMLHPDLGIPFARAVSRLSRGHRDESRFDAEALRAQIAEPRFQDGADAVVIGHFHHPTLLEREGRTFVVLGDWIENDTFASLEDGRIRLWRWEGSRATPIREESGGASGKQHEAPAIPAGGEPAARLARAFGDQSPKSTVSSARWVSPSPSSKVTKA